MANVPTREHSEFSHRWFRVRGAAGVANALTACRKAADVTQAELAERLGVSRTTVIRMESAPSSAIDRTVRAFSLLGYDLLAVPRGAGVQVTLDHKPTETT